MNEQFCNYEISKKLKDLGFNEECLAVFYQEKFMNGHIEPYVWNLINSIKTNSDCNSIDIVTAPLWQQAIDWFREKHRFHIQITPISYLNYTKIAYFYNIGSDDANKAIYDYQDKYGDVLDASSQEVPGNYLNDELYDKNIFDMDFAYKTYEDCREKAILKALEIIKSV